MVTGPLAAGGDVGVGTGVSVGDAGVFVGGTGVSVGDTAGFAGADCGVGTGVFVGLGVGVGRSSRCVGVGVGVGCGFRREQPPRTSAVISKTQTAMRIMCP